MDVWFGCVTPGQRRPGVAHSAGQTRMPKVAEPVNARSQAISRPWLGGTWSGLGLCRGSPARLQCPVKSRIDIENLVCAEVHPHPEHVGRRSGDAQLAP